jgi:hypothetical protein
MGGIGGYERPIGRFFGVFHWSVLKKLGFITEKPLDFRDFQPKKTKQDNTTRRLRPS